MQLKVAQKNSSEAVRNVQETRWWGLEILTEPFCLQQMLQNHVLPLV